MKTTPINSLSNEEFNRLMRQVKPASFNYDRRRNLNVGSRVEFSLEGNILHESGVFYPEAESQPSQRWLQDYFLTPEQVETARAVLNNSN